MSSLIGKNQIFIPVISLGREEIFLNVNRSHDGSDNVRIGFHLYKSKWDPYPWIGAVEKGSPAYQSGLRAGDCLLEIEGKNILGLEIQDVALLISKSDQMSLSIWRRPLTSPSENDQDTHCNDEDPKLLLEGPLPEVVQKLMDSASGIIKALECPVCLDSAAPPISQCVNGHILCRKCRLKTSSCPVCRVRLGRGRCLMAEKCHRVLKDSLLNKSTTSSSSLHRDIFGETKKVQQSEKNSTSPTKSRRTHLLSKLLLSPRQKNTKNVSTESLPSVADDCIASEIMNLPICDKKKSASTGELSSGSLNSNASQFLTVIRTPTLGGSADSLRNEEQVRCPLCLRESVQSNLLKHFQEQHAGPLIHYHKSPIVLSLPPPDLGRDAIYIVHEKQDLFLLQISGELVWMRIISQSVYNWKWSFQTKNVNLQREMLSHDSLQPSSEHIVNYTNYTNESSAQIRLAESHADQDLVEIGD